MSTARRRWASEPLVHFTILGGLVFLAWSALEASRDTPDDTPVIGPRRPRSRKG